MIHVDVAHHPDAPRSRGAKKNLPADMASLRRRAASMIGHLALSDNPDLGELMARVECLTGKRVIIQAIGDSTWESVTGLLLIRPRSAVILTRATDPCWFQRHIVLHEVAHLLFEHPGSRALPGHHPGSQFALQGQTVLARVMTPTTEADSVDFSNIEAVIEAEAEHLAFALSELLLPTWQTRPQRLSA